MKATFFDEEFEAPAAEELVRYKIQQEKSSVLDREGSNEEMWVVKDTAQDNKTVGMFRTVQNAIAASTGMNLRWAYMLGVERAGMIAEEQLDKVREQVTHI